MEKINVGISLQKGFHRDRDRNEKSTAIVREVIYSG